MYTVNLKESSHPKKLDTLDIWDYWMCFKEPFRLFVMIRGATEAVVTS